MDEREKHLRAEKAKRKRQVRRQKMILGFLVLFVFGATVFCNLQDSKEKKIADAKQNGKAAQTDSVEVNRRQAAADASDSDEQSLTSGPENGGQTSANEPDSGEQTSAGESDSVGQASANEPESSEQTSAGVLNENDPRPDFAVDPAKPVGSDTQTEEKVVYLTFDDGPSPLTQQILDILDRYNAKATFFVTNQDPACADKIKEAYDKGHTIGMHTSSHKYDVVYSSVDAYFADLDAIAQTVKAQIGYVPCFIRFPGGSSNTVSANITPGIMTALVQEVQNRGYQYYDWNGSSGDGAVRSTQELIAGGTTFTDNNIVYLSHDSASKQTTVEALPAIIEHYQAQGYTFKALDRGSYTAHHGVSN